MGDPLPLTEDELAALQSFKRLSEDYPTTTWGSADIAAEISAHRVQKSLDRLVEYGLIEESGDGEYRLTNQGRA